MTISGIKLATFQIKDIVQMSFKNRGFYKENQKKKITQASLNIPFMKFFIDLSLKTASLHGNANLLIMLILTKALFCKTSKQSQYMLYDLCYFIKFDHSLAL